MSGFERARGWASMTSRRSYILTGSLLLAAVLVALGGGIASAGTSGHEAGAEITIIVTDSKVIVTSPLKLGAATFEVVNNGAKPHELEITGPNVSKRTPRLGSGSGASLRVILKPGQYRLWDPLVLGKSKGRTLTVSAIGSSAATTVGTTPPASMTTTAPTVNQVCDDETETCHIAG